MKKKMEEDKRHSLYHWRTKNLLTQLVFAHIYIYRYGYNLYKSVFRNKCHPQRFSLFLLTFSYFLPSIYLELSCATSSRCKVLQPPLILMDFSKSSKTALETSELSFLLLLLLFLSAPSILFCFFFCLLLMS